MSTAWSCTPFEMVTNMPSSCQELLRGLCHDVCVLGGHGDLIGGSNIDRAGLNHPTLYSKLQT